MLLLTALVKCHSVGLFRAINSLSNPQYELNAEPGAMELGDEICGQNLGNGLEQGEPNPNLPRVSCCGCKVRSRE